MSSLCRPALQTLSPTEVLPKHLILPKSSLNQCTTIQLHLPEPEPPNGECSFTASISSGNHFLQADFCVRPTEGIIGGPKGTSSLTLHFTPIEYCTLTYEVIVTLHLAEETLVYVVKVVGSCFPNSESKENRREAACLEALATDLSSKPKKSRSKRQMKTPSRKKLQNNDRSDGSKLLTPTGLLKFLSKKQQDSMSGLGSQNVRDMEQQRREFEKVQSHFLRDFSTEEAKEKALALDYRSVRIGQDPVGGESIRRVRLEFQEQSLAYETLRGRNLAELLKLTKPRYSYQRISQDLDASRDNEIADNLKQENDLVLVSPKAAVLKPFVQAAYKIMLRYRVDKRIPAVRSLVQSTRTDT